jgi:peptidylprolyl isomerase
MQTTRRQLPPSSAVLAALALAACARAEGADVVARAGRTEVTSEQVRAYVATLDGRDQAALARDPALLSARLRAERAKANRQAYLAKLLDQNPPAVNELVLAGVLAKPEERKPLEQGERP